MKKIIASLLLALLLALSLTGCSSSDKDTVIYPNNDGLAKGQLGDTLRNSFFDFKVNSAYLTDKYEGYTAMEGYEFLVAEVTVKNIFGESIIMYDTDFQVQWSSDAEDAYDWPITLYLAEGENLGNDVLPAEYDLTKDESCTGLLVYEVPMGEQEFSIAYQEIFEDESVGNIFFVNFTAAHKQ